MMDNEYEEVRVKTAIYMLNMAGLQSYGEVNKEDSAKEVLVEVRQEVKWQRRGDMRKNNFY